MAENRSWKSIKRSFLNDTLVLTIPRDWKVKSELHETGTGKNDLS